MADVRGLKRQRSDEAAREHVKKAKVARDHHNHPPAFWDSLSKVPLTKRALRELDRRNNLRPSPRTTLPGVYPSNVLRFARHGGPDSRHLRGFPEPVAICKKMSSSRSSRPQSRQSRSTRGSSTRGSSATGRTTKTKSSAYDKAFEQKLKEHRIFLNDRRSKPANVKDIRSALAQERASLSPSRFSDDAFERFRANDQDIVFEHEVMSNAVPVICGTNDIPSRQNVLFTELEPIMDENTTKPKPDFFDGARLGELNKELRDDELMRKAAIPTKHAGVPVVPNFYLEVKSPFGTSGVAERQAGYDGAIGTRAMHTLQNVGADEPVYDGNAYTYSAIYQARPGTLHLYAHHVTDTPNGAEYHMSQIDTWGMAGSIDNFRRGTAAFRNARELAQRHRTRFIEAANARASQSDALTAEASQASTIHGIEDPSMSFTSSITSMSADKGKERSKRPRPSASPASDEEDRRARHSATKHV